uniref:ATP-dependent RNA helicase n=1 Tax=Panagrolaimus superbus TaxID=310955 RepID=A0A914ZF48_9BILA
MTSIEKFQASISADPSTSDKRMNCIQDFHYTKEEYKSAALIKFFQKTKAETNEYPRAAVFCNDSSTCLKLTLALNYSNINSLPLCKTAMNQFNNGEVVVLIFTDDLVQDVDFSQFDVIINYDFPKDIETYFDRMKYVCTERNVKYITFTVPQTDNLLVREITRTLGVTFNDIFESLTSFSTTPIPLKANHVKIPTINLVQPQEQQPLVRSFEAAESETDSENTADESEVSMVIKNAANVVGNQIHGVFWDIVDAFYDDAKFFLFFTVFSVVAFVLTYPFMRY